MICATNRNLDHEIKSGGFRADLFYRINVITYHVAFACANAATIFPIWPSISANNSIAASRKKRRRFHEKSLHLLQHRDWPGNVRELENCIARYVILGSEEVSIQAASWRRKKAISHFTYETT